MNDTTKYQIRQPGPDLQIARRVQTGTFRNFALEVVVGFDITEDRYIVHMYVTPPDGEPEKLESGSVYAHNERDAFRLGWQLIGEELAMRGQG